MVDATDALHADLAAACRSGVTAGSDTANAAAHGVDAASARWE